MMRLVILRVVACVVLAAALPAASQSVARGQSLYGNICRVCDDARQVAATLCAACHADDGNSVIPNFPKLAGQPAPYLAKQLDDFRSGKRKSDSMAPVLASVKARDFAALAAHFSAQKPAPGKVQDAALAAAGEQLYRKGNEATGVPGCAGCHLADGSGDEKTPRVAGQHQTYAIAEMMKFKTGARANDRRRAMRVLAELMTEAEIRAVAEYMAGL
jgi:cytochrome c553